MREDGYLLKRLYLQDMTNWKKKLVGSKRLKSRATSIRNFSDVNSFYEHIIQIPMEVFNYS